jgi:hypothetical protein
MGNQHFWLRISVFLIGGGLLVWLPFEESSTFGVLLFSVVICTWVLIYSSVRQFEQDRLTIIRSALVGLISGLSVSPLAFFLMAFKSGLHGHGTPDFTSAQIEQVLTWFPVFGLGGVMAGSAFRIWLRSSKRNPVAE